MVVQFNNLLLQIKMWCDVGWSRLEGENAGNAWLMVDSYLLCKYRCWVVVVVVVSGEEPLWRERERARSNVGDGWVWV